MGNLVYFLYMQYTWFISFMTDMYMYMILIINSSGLQLVESSLGGTEYYNKQW